MRRFHAEIRRIKECYVRVPQYHQRQRTKVRATDERLILQIYDVLKGRSIGADVTKRRASKKTPLMFARRQTNWIVSIEN